ncbi:molybdopterin guanine dinucleotide-containing S/N-oxide reductase [Ensifer sp. ENS05]|uniref:molybdopterin guanine dinucleotide-containing S/N-oxide reductase n=1 Tax=Ensifer sp. ENS05 TaxID=2769277 RepID=UPI00177BC0B7|nr:molybdopterin guanine dinucleotide-containing S/N-oxide reductase [Ensifer sp. ENS05]MBD9597370.1 molybdopterin guanine dinucleotide-containing S/N-oxide reductase [Ensifer sp. ENS05]
MSSSAPKPVLTTLHWGTYGVTVEDGRLTRVEPWAGDPDPSPIGSSLVGSVDGALRVARPAFRRAWLERVGTAPSGLRGAGPFVEVDWDDALDIVAAEVSRVRTQHGCSAIFGGSYGWASAGRFHHAQGQLHRFLNAVGGYTSSVNAYSYAAAEVILPHIIGSAEGLTSHQSTWDGIAGQGGLVVSFGGMPRRNAQVQGGGVGKHEVLQAMRKANSHGVRFISLSPVKDDGPDGIDFEWHALIPGTDTAVMLAMAHVLLSEELCDRTFLDRYTVGFEQVQAYVLGGCDGLAKTPEWAAGISGLSALTIRELARAMAATRTMIMVNWAIQRADHGEQPYWMAVTLAAMLGQIGLPGGGFGFGYSSTNGAGRAELPFKWPSVAKGKNPVSDFIPVARIADMLLNPGDAFDFNGRRLVYPDIRMIWWAGGNPFHHHQDLNRLVQAWQRPETIIVNEPYWTATARHADIVMPVTTPLERDDLAFSNRENFVVAMKRVVDPVGDARDDFAIFADLAARLGVQDAFTEGRSAADWVKTLYDDARSRASSHGSAMPDFETFWRLGSVEVERTVVSHDLLSDFRADPAGRPLRTPSGRIELFSDTIAGFRYEGIPGHAVWREPREWLGSPQAREFPLHLLSPQPADKLHSQYDQGAVSSAAKVAGRTRLLMNRQDAEARGIDDGDVVKVFNSRGACLAGAKLVDTMLRGVVQLPTGSWFDPENPGVPGSLERHGNPNVLTPDRGTSPIGQGPTCNSALVEVVRFDGLPPAVEVLAPPAIVSDQVKGTNQP